VGGGVGGGVEVEWVNACGGGVGWGGVGVGGCATSNKQQATSNKQQATSNKQQGRPSTSHLAGAKGLGDGARAALPDRLAPQQQVLGAVGEAGEGTLHRRPLAVDLRLRLR
jgi:hypothetical protein